MVEPDPDVPDALAHIGGDLLPRVRAAGADMPGRPPGAEDAGLGEIARLDLAEPSVQRVEGDGLLDFVLTREGQKTVQISVTQSGSVLGVTETRLGKVVIEVAEAV